MGIIQFKSGDVGLRGQFNSVQAAQERSKLAAQNAAAAVSKVGTAARTQYTKAMQNERVSQTCMQKSLRVAILDDFDVLSNLRMDTARTGLFSYCCL